MKTEVVSVETKKKKSGFHWLAWWQIDPEELVKQIDGYNTLKFYQTARGMSVLCFLFTLIITGGMIYFSQNSEIDNFIIDMILIAILMFFMGIGQRWAMIASMIYWTFTKGFLILNPDQFDAGAHSIPFVQIIWWTIYMHVFWLAFRVEQGRKVKIQGLVER